MAALSTDQEIGVIGAGTMGAGIAQVAAAAGHSVNLFDNAPGAAQKGVDGVRSGLERLVSRGKMSTDTVSAIVERIRPTDSIEALANSALIIEAIVENLDIKQQVFSKLEEICDNTVILATNTSSISVTTIAAGLNRPENLVGMHFFNPAPIMKLVEVISGVATDPGIAEQVFETSLAWGKKPVHAKSTPGFIVNRVARPFYAEGMRVLQEGGGDIPTLDAIVKESGGFRMGPFELMDLIGNDINYAVCESVFNAYYQDPRFKPSVIQREYVNAGYLGRKSGRGYYDYGDQAQPESAQEVNSNIRPTSIVANGNLGVATPLLALAANAGIRVGLNPDSDVDNIEIEGVCLKLTDGRSATQLAAESGNTNIILFDLALDYEKATRIALCAADQADSNAIDRAVGFFRALDKKVSVIDDIPGMIVMRTVCTLANEGADTVNQQVCDAAAVDTAMCGGVNYPKGPLAWADSMGLNSVTQVLTNLYLAYGEDRYRVSPLLQRKTYAGGKFIE